MLSRIMSPGWRFTFEETPMRNLPCRKPFHRKLLLCSAIASLILVPSAFAHSHHGASAYAASGHAGFNHRNFASSRSHANAQDEAQAFSADRSQSLTTADSRNSRKHDRVPDEEELAQPEL